MLDGHRGASVGSILMALVALVGLTSAAAAQRPTLTPNDYGRWERLGAFSLDPLGSWLVTSITRVDETRELRLSRTREVGDPLVLQHASGPEFSRDGRWLAYRKGVSPEEAEASEDRIQARLGLVDLASAVDSVLFDVTTFAFRDDGAWLAARGVPAADSVGADLIVLNPATHAQTLIGNVSEFAWQDEGALLAATLRTAWGTANGVVLFDPEAGTLRTLDSRDAEYQALSWRDDSAQLAVMRSVEADDRDGVSHDVLVWEDVRSAAGPRVLAALGRADLTGAYRVTEFAGIDFDVRGRTLFVGLRPWEAAAAQDDGGGAAGTEEADQSGGSDRDRDSASGARADDDSPGVEPADVQVWHWNDDQILRAQEYRAGSISRQTLAAAWHLDDDRVVILGDDLEEGVSIIAGGRWGVVPDYDPYLFERRFGAGTADWYRVDVQDGARTLLATAVEFAPVTHEDMDWALVYDEEHWSSVRVSTGARTPIGDGMSFTRSLADYDFPGPRPSWGFGAWLEGESAVLLNDEHDVWRAELSDGTLRRLTDGAEAGVTYRVVNLDPDAPFFAAPTLARGERPWLSVSHSRTKESGYARLTDRGAETVVFEDALVGRLTKARSADVMAFRSERWDDSPDVFVGDADLGDLRQVTRTNPFQADFAWGHTELLEYTTDAGHDLQAILAYPADFQEGRHYPLILYQYERLSDNLHSYNVPSERSYYNYQVWTQQGYFVLMPDIVYEPGRPGPSALDAVEHALDAAVATGHVDPGGMGLIGHSWGGYQASYLPTRTNRFAASVAGAAITNFLSFMGAVHWNGGLPETGHWETGQARMAAPYWEDLAGHLESSPANFIADLETPMLLMHGDSDGVVDFRQGLEFYNYARRAGKEVVLLVYPGADHGLSDEAQQVDYHRRILEWFGHYLKGEVPPKWIREGESWAEREKRIGGG